MHHSTEPFGTLVLPESGFAFEVGSLYDRLEQLRDARHARGKRYALALLLTLIILGKLSGEDRPEGIAEWARFHQVELSELLPLERETLPCANTYRSAVGTATDPDAFQAVVQDFLRAQPQAGRSVLISIDGKTLRGTLNAQNPSGVHLLAAYLPEEGLTLMQLEVDATTTEVTVAPRLLKSLDLRGKVVMGDALHTQRALSVQIVAAGGEYLWLAKANQPKLHDDLKRLFVPEVCGAGSRPLPTDFESVQHSDKGHGRIEVRTLTTSALLNPYLDWPQVGQVFRLERRVRQCQSHSWRREVVYGLTSLTRREADPRRLLALTRAYWGIENGLHYRRDVTLHEDATRMKNTHAARIWASLNNLLIGLLRPLGFADLPRARRYFAAQPALAVATLTRRRL